MLFEDCEITECRTIGINARNGVLSTMRRCVVHHNGTSGIYFSGQCTIGRLMDCKSYCNIWSGIVAHSGSRVDVYGESTEIYENCSGGDGYGIKVCKEGSEVCFHVPEHDRLIHDNGNEQNTKEIKGGRVWFDVGEGKSTAASSAGSAGSTGSAGSAGSAGSTRSTRSSTRSRSSSISSTSKTSSVDSLVKEVLLKSRSNSFAE